MYNHGDFQEKTKIHASRNAILDRSDLLLNGMSHLYGLHP